MFVPEQFFNPAWLIAPVAILVIFILVAIFIAERAGDRFFASFMGVFISGAILFGTVGTIQGAGDAKIEEHFQVAYGVIVDQDGQGNSVILPRSMHSDSRLVSLYRPGNERPEWCTVSWDEGNTNRYEVTCDDGPLPLLVDVKW